MTKHDITARRTARIAHVLTIQNALDGYALGMEFPVSGDYLPITGRNGTQRSKVSSLMVK